jgi:hypothetical protein
MVDQMSTNISAHADSGSHFRAELTEGKPWLSIEWGDDAVWPKSRLLLFATADQLAEVVAACMEEPHVESAVWRRLQERLMVQLLVRATTDVELRRVLVAEVMALPPVFDKADDDDDEPKRFGWPICPICGHVARCHDKLGGLAVGCTGGGRIRGDGTCACRLVADVGAERFRHPSTLDGDELVDGWGFTRCNKCETDIGCGSQSDGVERLRRHWADEHADTLAQLSLDAQLGYVTKYRAAASLAVTK